MEMKERGVADQRPAHYGDIKLIKNAPHGAIIGGLAFVFGFAMIWYLWWLAILALLGIIFTVIARASDDDIHYIVPAAEVERLETERFASWPWSHRDSATDQQSISEPVPEV
jgi:cytochrome o ubiquinol oxidase subunit 1